MRRRSLDIEGLSCSQNTTVDFSGYIAFLKRHGIFPGARIHRFWLFMGLWHATNLRRPAYDVYSYGIAEDRRSYAIEKLDIRHIDEPFRNYRGPSLAGSFDCFFSAHVLEHVPSPSKVIDLAWRCLKDGRCRFIAFTPNGSDRYRRFQSAWSGAACGVMCIQIFLDEVFYDTRIFPIASIVLSLRQGSPLHEAI